MSCATDSTILGSTKSMGQFGIQLTLAYCSANVLLSLLIVSVTELLCYLHCYCWCICVGFSITSVFTVSIL